MLTYTLNLTAAKRQAIAVLMLAIVFTNSHISVAQAAESMIVANPLVNAFAIPVVADEPKAAPEVAPTVQEVLLDVCKTRGYGQDCAQTLLGMLWNESSNRSTVIGDNGKARGYFQIHYKVHKITTDCAEDLVCSANWTLDYLERNQYPKYVSYAVQCHNGCNINNGYAAKALRNGKNFWNKPLQITQAAPIILAAK